MNKLKITIIAIMVALTAFLFLLPNQPDAVWLKWLSIALWIVLIIIIARNSDLFERPKIEDKEPKNIKIDPDLEEFLIRKGAYDAFCKEIHRKLKKRNRQYTPCVIDNVNKFITWKDTPQGVDYWLMLYEEYQEKRIHKTWE